MSELWPPPTQVERTTVGRYDVSTIRYGSGTFETMIFDNLTGDTDVRKELGYRTTKGRAALTAHEHAVDVLQAEVDAEGSTP